jgi:hypothetical protein
MRAAWSFLVAFIYRCQTRQTTKKDLEREEDAYRLFGEKRKKSSAFPVSLFSSLIKDLDLLL